MLLILIQDNLADCGFGSDFPIGFSGCHFNYSIDRIALLDCGKDAVLTTVHLCKISLICSCQHVHHITSDVVFVMVLLLLCVYI